MNINEAIQTAFMNYQNGKLQQAEHLCKEILIHEPNNINAIYLLGGIYYQTGNYEFAIKYFTRAIELTPHFAEAYNNLGLILQEKGKLDEAITYIEKAIQIKPNFAEAHNHMGMIMQKKGKLDEAIIFYKKAIQLNPNLATTYSNLGTLLQKEGTSESIKCFEKAVDLQPSAESYNNLGNALMEKGYLDKAETMYRKAQQISPTFSKSYSNLLLMMNYDYENDAQQIFLEHKKFGEKFVQPSSYSFKPYIDKRFHKRKLRLGYVSPDFKTHSVSYFIESVLKAHNHDEFEIFCYSDVLVTDHVTIRIQDLADHWRNIVGMSDEEISKLIQTDHIDILVDLAGHTANNRMLVFARKPAPVQVTWIGYPATTGLSSIDYKIVDHYTNPLGETEHLYTEKLIRMPESFLCYLPPKESPEINDLPAASQGYVTFGSFNNFSKISPEVFKLWVEILKVLPDARFIIKARSFADQIIRKNTMNIFSQGDIDSKRIELLSWQPSLEEHLKVYHRVDIALDTFPYNGTTTTCEALWMGVPVITLSGNTPTSKVGISLLSNIELQDFIANTQEGYIEIAVVLASEISMLQKTRETLRDQMIKSPLMYAERFTVNLERSYMQMWEEYCKTN